MVNKLNDALDRLERGYPLTDADLATVRDELERLREERDEATQYGARWRRYHDAMTVRAEAAEAEVRRLREDIRQVRLWFERATWEGRPDPSSFGGHGPYSPAERELGYGTFRDPRFLPDALLSASPSDGEPVYCVCGNILGSERCCPEPDGGGA